MTDQHIGPLVSGDEIGAELRRRRKPHIYKTVSASNRELIAQKVELEETDGWSVAKENAKSTRMAKLKPLDERLEDEIWTILAQMGFNEMSKGRQFTIPVDAGLKPRQIDVYAKDDETVVMVECTQREKPGRKNLSILIDKIRAIRGRTVQLIRKLYGQDTKLKVKYVIATRNIDWTAADLEKCRLAKIAVITDNEIEYYAALVKHLKQAARYQLLAHLFSGQKIDGLANDVVATRGKMGGDTFYTFLMPPDELLKIAYVGHKASRDIENLETYQRLLKPPRLKKIAEFINRGGKLPTNIVVNLRTTRRSGLRFDVTERFENGTTLGKLSLPSNYASAWIIDGQHRLYGYAYARNMEGFNQDSSMIPVLAYENLPADKEMNLFIDINSEQVKVSTDLVVELYGSLHWESDDPEDAFKALLSRIASRLNSDKTSPLYDRILVAGTKKTHFRCLTQTSIRDGLRVSKLLGSHKPGAIVPGPLSTVENYAYGANLKKGLSVLKDCLRMFEDQLPDHWNLGDGPDGYLCTNNGLRALFQVICDIADEIRRHEGRDICQLDAHDTMSALEPYLQVLVDWFTSAAPVDVRVLRRTGSSLTAVHQQALGMEAHIHEKLPAFTPPDLQDYLDSRNVAGTEEAAAKVRRIQGRLSHYVIETLKSRYGTQDKAWWTRGIPLNIRQECTTKWEAENRDGDEESHLYLINYIPICEANWDLFKGAISLDSKDKDNRKASTKWIKDLNEIRNITSHPERGVLSNDQVSFVTAIFDKVHKYVRVPAGVAQA